MTDVDAKQLEAQFIGLVSILANSALQQLGKVMNPATGQVERNLEGARMTIDWLRMLKAKTEGNLTTEEERIVSSYISNLQLNYLDECEKDDTAETSDEKETTADANAEETKENKSSAETQPESTSEDK